MTSCIYKHNVETHEIVCHCKECVCLMRGSSLVCYDDVEFLPDHATYTSYSRKYNEIVKKVCIDVTRGTRTEPSFERKLLTNE